MDKIVYEKKTNCLCSNCGRCFDYTKAIDINMNLYGLVKPQKACPFCNSFGFTRADHRYFLDSKEYNRQKPIVKEKEKRG